MYTLLLVVSFIAGAASVIFAEILGLQMLVADVRTTLESLFSPFI